MGYRMCKCLRCGKPLDRNIEKFVEVKGRWAHQSCEEEYQKKVTEAKLNVKDNREKHLNDYHDIMDFARDHFLKPNYALIQKQIKEYINQRGYTLTGIHKSLIYYYDIKKNPTSKGNGGIGAVGLCYNDAKEYYRKLAKIQKENEKKIKTENIEITILEPKRKSRLKEKFNFLDMEVKDE